MGMYMYPIKVSKKKQHVKVIEQHTLENGLLTLADLRQYLKEGDKFSISEIESGVFSYETILTVHKTRLETNEERDLRVNRELSYMAEYNKRHKTI